MSSPILPEDVQAQVDAHRQALQEASLPDGGSLDALITQADQQVVINQCLALSDYCATQWLQNPELLAQQLGEQHFARELSVIEIEERFLAIRDQFQASQKTRHQVQSSDEQYDAQGFDADVKQQLRQARHYFMTGLITRFATSQDSVETQMRLLSKLADHAIETALQIAEMQLLQEYGAKPEGRMTVIGMGKLGGYELNLSSDIDLMFVYPREGEFENRRGKSVSHQKYFTKLGQKLISYLDDVTGDGFVFRVDMRLRPWGQSGALAINRDAFINYYENHGREWERYAMMKARPVAGAVTQGNQLLEQLQPFIYRRYIDYSVIQSLREMKRLISREVLRKGMQDNIKLGQGGIREVEFFVQALQMVRGGIEFELRDSRLKAALEKLEDIQLVPAQDRAQLWTGYLFLRQLEHALQALQDRQTQILPQDSLSQSRIAWFMGFADWPSFYAELQRITGQVHAIFQDLFAEPEAPKSEQMQDSPWQGFWTTDLDELDENVSEDLASSFADRCVAPLKAFKNSRDVLGMLAKSRSQLDAIMPPLIQHMAEMDLSAAQIEQVLAPIKAMTHRTIYLSLLQDQPNVLQRMVQLCSTSPWISRLIFEHPALLDELINAETLFSPLDKAQLQDELRQQLLRIPEDDVEQQLLTLRYFKLAHSLRVAASEVTGSLSVMHVSDSLTWLAEVLVDAALKLATAHVQEKYGCPADEQGQSQPIRFIVLAYGKLGGIELSYSSDLDLVFVYDAGASGMTNGARSIEVERYYIRLGQRLVHVFNSQTALGTLYEVDTRLRPSGASGLLVTSLQAYKKYQFEHAWTWEHQALVRSRAIAGEAETVQAFNTIRQEVLGQQRDAQALKEDVLKMREKMREHLGSKAAECFDIKQDKGGIVDIEFLVQYLVLREAHQHGQITRWTDNVRQLDALAQTNVLSEAQAQQLKQHYLSYRAKLHQLALAGEGRIVSHDQYHTQRKQVSAIWESVFNLSN